MKIAIVRLSSLGDIIKNASTIQMIKKYYPNSEITWIADSIFADILDNTKDLDNIIKMDLKRLKKNFSFKNLKNELNKLPKNYFDIVIESHGMLKASLIAKRVSKKKICGFDKIIKEKLSKLFYTKSCPFECDENEIYRYNKLSANCLEFDFEKDDIYKLEPFLGYKNRDYSKYDKFFKEKNIILAFGSSKGWESKKYPLDKWINIINNLNYNFLLIWGNDTEKKEAEYIASKTNAMILPKTTFNDLKYLISKSDLIIGNDTGPTHIGWAIGTKSIIIFGCTDKNLMIENEHHIGIKSNSKVNYCKFDKNDFSIESIDEKLIISKIKELL